VAARVARAGAAPVRLMLAPARGLARSPRAGSAMRSGVERMSATAGGVFETEAERAVDAVLAGPLPEAVARSMVARPSSGRSTARSPRPPSPVTTMSLPWAQRVR